MISTIGWIVICFFLLIVKYAFLQPKSDSTLFYLYEARDNVAIAAIEGKISQDAKEYKFVINDINFALYYMKNNYDFSIVFKNIFLKPEEVQNYFSHMFQLVKQYDFLEENYQITRAYFKRSLYIRLFFYIHLIIRPVCFVLSLIIILLRALRKFSNSGVRFMHAAERRIDIISEINDDYKNYKKLYVK